MKAINNLHLNCEKQRNINLICLYLVYELFLQNQKSRNGCFSIIYYTSINLMFSFLKNQANKAQQNLINKSGYFDSQHHKFNMPQLRKGVKKILHKYEKGGQVNIFQILAKKDIGFLQPIKTLCLIHMMLQIIEGDSLSLNIDFLIAQLNKITAQATNLEEKQIIQNKINRERKKSQEIDQKYIKQETYDNQNNDVQVPKNASFIREKATCPSSSSSTKNYHLESESNQVYIGTQIIKPYTSFLLKYIGFITNKKEEKDKISKLWPCLNLLKSLLNVCDSFNKVMIYFGDCLWHDIVAVVEIMDRNIHKYYRIIVDIVMEKMQIVDLKYSYFLKQNLTKSQMLEKLKTMIECMDLQMLKEIVEELLFINDSLVYLYQSKIIRSYLQAKNIVSPKTINLTDEPITLLYEVLTAYDKYEKGIKSRKIKKAFTFNVEIKNEFDFTRMRLRKDSIEADSRVNERK